MDSDKTINAYFARTYHEVEVLVTPDRHGYVRGGGSVLHGTEITLNAEELSDPDTVPFSHWVVNGIDQEVDEANPMKLVLTVEDSLRVEAVFDYGLPESMKHVAAGSFTMGDRSLTCQGAKASSCRGCQRILHRQLGDLESHSGTRCTPGRCKMDTVFVLLTEANGRNRPHNDGSYQDDFPITGVSWHDMVKWSNARSEKEGLEPVYFTDTGKKQSTAPTQNKMVEARNLQDSLSPRHMWTGAPRDIVCRPRQNGRRPRAVVFPDFFIRMGTASIVPAPITIVTRTSVTSLRSWLLPSQCLWPL